MFHDILQQFDRSFGEESGKWNPGSKVINGEDAYVIEAQLPGVARENIKLNLEKDVLTLSGERNVEPEQETQAANRGSFEERFQLDVEELDVNNLKASYKDGLLKVTIPKKKVESVSINIE